MSESIEIEYKNMLTADEYQLLVKKLAIQPEQFFTQTNLYFDTADKILEKNRCALRVRIKENNQQAEATLKSPLPTGLLETNVPLTWEIATEVKANGVFPIADEITKKLQTYHISRQQLTLIGSLTTKRCEVQMEGNLIVLDENWYGQIHDFELEIEVTDSQQGKLFFKQFLTENQLPLRPTKNKIIRMLTEKGQRR